MWTVLTSFLKSPCATLPWHDRGSTALKTVADILERELRPMTKEWLRRVNLVPELTNTPLSDADRTGHLHNLYRDLIHRLRLAKDTESPISVAAAAHGQIRRAQGYTAAMLIEESRLFEIATFSTLHLHQSELNPRQVLSDIAVIADEVDAQLTDTVRNFMDARLPAPAVA